MAAPGSRPTADALAAFAGAVRAGCSLSAAARSVGVDPRTARRWVAKSRGGVAGYEGLAEVVDASQTDPGDWPMDEEELFLVMSRAARRGDARAGRFILGMLIRDLGISERCAARQRQWRDDWA